MFYEYVKLLSHRAHMHTWFLSCLEAERRARVLRTNVPFVDCSEEVNVIVRLLLEYRIYCTPMSSLHRESTDSLIICYKLKHNLPTLPTYFTHIHIQNVLEWLTRGPLSSFLWFAGSGRGRWGWNWLSGNSGPRCRWQSLFLWGTVGNGFQSNKLCPLYSASLILNINVHYNSLLWLPIACLYLGRLVVCMHPEYIVATKASSMVIWLTLGMWRLSVSWIDLKESI